MDTKERLVKKQMAAHLPDLMPDAQMYGWERARTFHSVWLKPDRTGGGGAVSGRMGRRS